MNVQAAKRYACDRCREQKLRCSRPQHDGSTCDRCLRVRVLCVTSNGRPLGRPPLHGASRAHANSNQASSPRRRSCERWRPRSRISMTMNQHISPNARESILSEPATMAPHGTAPSNDMGGFQEESDYLNDASNPAVFTDASTPQHEFWNDPAHMGNMDFGTVDDMAEPICEVSGSSTGIVDDSEQQLDNPSLNGNLLAFPASAMRCISRQLAELKCQAVESWAPRLIQSALFDEHSHWTCSSPTGFNSWDNTIQITMRFVLVLHTMVPAQFSNGLQAMSLPTLSTTLIILSTYIQLGELFDTFLTRIRICLEQDFSRPELPSLDASASEGKQSIPQLAKYRILIMIQVLEHQLHSVECALGIPSNCRFWSRKAYAGIFDQEKISMLTHGVMIQAQEIFRSIKQTIERIQTSLRL
jgi:hypothetical protein